MDSLMGIEARIREKFVKKGVTLAVAESCTGGLIGSRLTDVPGCSDYFTGGIVSYANSAKVKLLGVPAALVREYGAVSEPVARKMAQGVRRRFAAGVGIAVTGIAGPGGGTREKPVGLVYMAVASGKRVTSAKRLFSGSRVQIKKQSADAVLRMALAFIR